MRSETRRVAARFVLGIISSNNTEPHTTNIQQTEQTRREAARLGSAGQLPVTVYGSSVASLLYLHSSIQGLRDPTSSTPLLTSMTTTLLMLLLLPRRLATAQESRARQSRAEQTTVQHAPAARCIKTCNANGHAYQPLGH